jgi:hypothetical protein
MSIVSDKSGHYVECRHERATISVVCDKNCLLQVRASSCGPTLLCVHLLGPPAIILFGGTFYDDLCNPSPALGWRIHLGTGFVFRDHVSIAVRVSCNVDGSSVMRFPILLLLLWLTSFVRVCCCMFVGIYLCRSSSPQLMKNGIAEAELPRKKPRAIEPCLKGVASVRRRELGSWTLPAAMPAKVVARGASAASPRTETPKLGTLPRQALAPEGAASLPPQACCSTPAAIASRNLKGQKRREQTEQCEFCSYLRTQWVRTAATRTKYTNILRELGTWHGKEREPWAAPNLSI